MKTWGSVRLDITMKVNKIKLFAVSKSLLKKYNTTPKTTASMWKGESLNKMKRSFFLSSPYIPL